MTEGRPPRDAEDAASGKRPRIPDPLAPPQTIASEGWAVLSTLIAGIAVWAGIGYGLDRAFGISALLPIGMLLGMVASIYLIVVKYGR